MTILCMAFFMSCSDDAPKQDTKPTTGSNNDNQNGEDGSVIKMSDLTSDTWSGTYYYARRASYTVYETVDINFVHHDDKNGIGRMIVKECGGYTVNKSNIYQFDFQIEGRQVVCQATKLYAEEDEKAITILLEWCDGMLYLKGPNFAPVLLGKGVAVLSDADGIIQDKSELVNQVWLHENGLNILDLRRDISYAPRAVQLVEPGSLRFNFDLYGNSDFYNYIENSICFNASGKQLLWTIIELSEEKMILKGYKDDIEDVFYAASPDIVPLIHVPNMFGAPWGIGGNY